METFYIIVPTIAVVILIIVLTYLGIKIKNAKATSTSFPPIYNTCPDYWTVDATGNCVVPTSATAKNIGSFGNTVSGTVTIPSGSTPGYSNGAINFFNSDGSSSWSINGMSPQCAMKYWSNQNGIVWDGISNYNGCSF